MRVHNGHDIGPSLKDRRVNEPLEVERTVFVPHRLRVEAEFDDIFRGDQFRGDRACNQKMPRIVRVSDTDMPVRVHHVLFCEDAVGDHEILDEGVKAAHGHDDPRKAERTRLWRQSNAKGSVVATANSARTADPFS
jgi:hypothetical protein